MSLRLKLYRKKERYKKMLNAALHSSCTVLLYHRVYTPEQDPQQLCVSPELFYEQLKTLKNKHRFLSVAEYFEILTSRKKFPKKSLLITFDDGYADNLYNAVPVLEALNLQGLFYVATNRFYSNELFWWDELDCFFASLEKKNLIELSRSQGLENIGDLYEYYLKKCKLATSLEERERILNQLRKTVLLNEEKKKEYKFLDKDELLKMAASKSVVIGAHTVNHLSLAHLSLDDQMFEIKKSVQQLSELLPYKMEHFSFPYGERHNYNEDTIRICKEIGLKSAAANYCDRVTPNSDIFSFPRFVVRNDKPELLLKKLKNCL